MNDAREKIITKYFNCWIHKDSTSLFEIFAENCYYIESHGVAYKNFIQIKTWFEDWITKGTVFEFVATKFFHKDNMLAVEWHFKYDFYDPEDKYNYTNVPFEFDGISIIKFNHENKIEYLREYKSDLPRCYPYLDL